MSNPQQGNNDTLTSTLSPISSENIRQNIDDAANGCGDNNNIKYECSICYESIKPPKLFGILCMLFVYFLFFKRFFLKQNKKLTHKFNKFIFMSLNK